MSDIFIGSRIEKLDIGEAVQNISRVNVVVDSDNMYTSGDDTGRTVEVECPWGSQAMADSILSKVRGYDYKPYSGEKAILDPAFEIGDTVTVGGVYSVLAYVDTIYNGAALSSISAPEGDEIDEEYPSYATKNSSIKRQLAQTRSLITKTAEEIRLEVENEVNGLSASIDIQLDSITSQISGYDGQISTLTQTANSLQSQITTANGNISSLEQYVDSMTLSVSNGATSSTIKLMAGDTTISSQSITFSGIVTFSDLSTSGETIINGDNITTGTITAINISGCTITGSTFQSILEGDGTVSGEIQLYYLYAESGWLAGGIRLDDQGTGTAEESQYRMYIYTSTILGVAFALKIQAAGNCSIASDNSVYLNAGTSITLTASKIYLVGTVYVNDKQLTV